MAEETNSNTGGSFSGGNMDLSNSVFAPHSRLGGRQIAAAEGGPLRLGWSSCRFAGFACLPP